MIEAICFDLDDTLFDYTGLVKAALSYLCDEMALITGRSSRECSMAYSRVKDALYKDKPADPAVFDWRDRIRRTLELMGARGSDAEVEALYRSFWTRFLSMIEPFPDVRPGLEALRRLGKKIAVVSNGTREQQSQKLERLGLLDFFECQVYSEDVGVNKPHPSVFRRCLELLDVDPQRAMMAGDLCYIDVYGARRVGMVTCWVKRNGLPIGRPRRPSEFPDFTVRNLQELARLVQVDRSLQS